MVNYHALTSSLNLSGTNVVVVGGTHGIGAAIATRFAELGSSVLIMGRNESAGNAIVSAMRNAARDTEAKLTFVRADLGAVEAIRKAADDIAAWAGAKGVDYLVQSQGGPGMSIWPPTRDSATIGFNVQTLSHFLIPYLLLSRPQPVLRQGAQINNIMRPGGLNRVINLEDPMGLSTIENGRLAYLKNGLNMFFMIDLFTEEFNRRFPQTRTTHVYPGSVSTGSFAGFGWFLRHLLAFAQLFSQSPEAYADIAVWEHASDEWKARGWAFFDNNGKEVTVDKRVTEEGDDGVRAAVWAKMLELAGGEQL